MNQNLLCVYHANCDDGFGAAWAVRHAFLDRLNPMSSMNGVEFYAAVHAGKPPDVKGRLVVFVDFVYPRPIMELLIADAEHVTVLDHHKSSMLEWVNMFGTVESGLRDDILETSCTKVDGGFERAAWKTEKASFEFDMKRSGARMAWDHFHPASEFRPLFIDYIQDHDLWTKKLASIDEFTAALRSYPMDFEQWDSLFGYGSCPAFDTRGEAMGALIRRGDDILRYKRQLVDIAVKNSFWVEIKVPGPVGRHFELQPDGLYHVPVRIRGANVMPAISSEVGEELALKYGGQSLTWIEGYPKWTYSLRSRAVDGLPATDISLIAKAMGGGGHAQAAGFKTTEAVHRVIGRDE